VNANGPGRTPDDVCWWPARDVAAAIAARRLSAREYLTAQWQRVERENPAINAVVTLDETAFERADEADRAVRRGDPLGPLHGVAMTVKDSLATAGIRTTGGLAMLGNYVPREDAAAVAGLRRAGAIVFGKTNLPEASGDLQAYNEVFGVSRNPWHPEHSTSGSSGGGAAAVSAGLSPIELGSDVAGSIRLPAAACGVAGHKPSFGIVPMIGHVPPAPFRPRELDLNVIGPIAREVADLRTALLAMVGPHPLDQPGWRLQLPEPPPIRRVATWFDDPYCPVDDEVTAALRNAAEALAATGVVVEPARPGGLRLKDSDQVFRRLLATVALPGLSAQDIEELAAGRTAPGSVLGGEFVAQRYRDWAEAADRRLRMRERWRHFFTRYDAILLPVAPNLVIRHDHRPFAERDITVNGQVRPYWDQTVWAGLTGVSHLPSTTVPVGRDSRGLPIGVAVATDYLQDLTALEVAGRLSGVLPSIGHPGAVAATSSVA
jgi:amidase